MWIVLCDVLVGVMIEFLICINQFLNIQCLSSTCWLHAPGTMWKGAQGVATHLLRIQRIMHLASLKVLVIFWLELFRANLGCDTHKDTRIVLNTNAQN